MMGTPVKGRPTSRRIRHQCHCWVYPFVPEMGVGLDPGGDLDLDGLGQEAPGSSAEEVGQGVARRGRRHEVGRGGRLIHGGVLLGHFGRSVVWRFTKGTPPSSSVHQRLSVIAPKARLTTRGAFQITGDVG
jgi:hypothetical protein